MTHISTATPIAATISSALTIDSTLGQGATFTVSLPELAREAAA